MTNTSEIGNSLSSHETEDTTFMTPEEFREITGEYLESLSVRKSSDYDLSHGYKGNVIPDERIAINKDGQPVVSRRFSISLSSQLSDQEKGITFLELLDVIRLQEKLKKEGASFTSIGEDTIRSARVKRGASSFYEQNQDMVDKFISNAARNPENINR